MSACLAKALLAGLQSSGTLGAAQRMAPGHNFDLGVFDEAHHTATRNGGEATAGLFDTHQDQVRSVN